MNAKNKIDHKTLKKLSKLSRLEINNSNNNDLIEDLNKILGFVDQLNEVNTNKVDPLNSVTGHSLPLREDEVKDGNISEIILKNAPEKSGDYFVVPKVIE